MENHMQKITRGITHGKSHVVNHTWKSHVNMKNHARDHMRKITCGKSHIMGSHVVNHNEAFCNPESH